MSSAEGLRGGNPLVKERGGRKKGVTNKRRKEGRDPSRERGK